MRIVISVCGGLIAVAAIIVLGYIVIKELFFTPRKKTVQKQSFSVLFTASGIFFALLLVFWIAAILTSPRRAAQIFSPGMFSGSILSPLSILPQAVQLPLSFFSFLAMAHTFSLYAKDKPSAVVSVLLSPFIFTAVQDWSLSLGAAATLLAIVFVRRQQYAFSALYAAISCICTPLTAAAAILLFPQKKALKYCVPAIAGVTICNLFFSSVSFSLPYTKISAWLAAGNIQGLFSVLFFVPFLFLCPMLLYAAKGRLSLPENVYIGGMATALLCTSNFGPEGLIFLFPLFVHTHREDGRILSAILCGLFTACCGLFSMF